MVFVGNLIADLLDSPTNEAVLNRVHSQVLAVTERFPVYSQNQGA